MKPSIRLLLLTSYLTTGFLACQPSDTHSDPSVKTETAPNRNVDKQQIAAMLDSFNRAAAKADFNGYFHFFTDNATFTGTDATEYWKKDSFMRWAKPYFDKGKAWNFTSIQRHIDFGTHPDIAWFDELLQTQMKICRGSGVVVKQDNHWKIEQYILSMTVPNAKTKVVVKEKSAIEDSLIQGLIH